MRTKRQIIICILLGGLLFQASEGSLQAQRVKSGTTSFHLNYVPDKSVDNRPPVLEVLNPPLKVGVPFYTKEDQLDLFVKVSDENRIQFVSVNQEVPIVNQEGNFGTTLHLENGDNELIIRAKDAYGNLNELVFIINYEPPVVTLADMIHLKSTYYALLIGINEYENEDMEDLNKPLADASNLYTVLTSYYNFDRENTLLLRNPTRLEIIQEFNVLREKVTSSDNLLIFYAGHGSYDKQAKTGYWLPSDASKTNTANWFQNSTLVNQLRGIQSKHTLLITDACFAGSILKTREVNLRKEMKYDMIYEEPSRKALTSGNMTEVPDESAFIKYLIKYLKENKSEYMSAEELYTKLRDPVIYNNATRPLYGVIPNVGSENGDFVFLKDIRK